MKYKVKRLCGGEQFRGYYCDDGCNHLRDVVGRCNLYKERISKNVNKENENFGKFGRCIACLEEYFPNVADLEVEENEL